jgi:hypothetical protein
MSNQDELVSQIWARIRELEQAQRDQSIVIQAQERETQDQQEAIAMEAAIAGMLAEQYRQLALQQQQAQSWNQLTPQEMDRRVIHTYIAMENPVAYLVAISTGFFRVLILSVPLFILTLPFLLIALGILVPSTRNEGTGTPETQGVIHYESGSTSH